MPDGQGPYPVEPVAKTTFWISATPLFASLVAKQTISSWISLVLNLYCGFADLTRGAENVQPSNPQ